MEIKKIVTHHRPHADELIALMLLQKFPEGEKKYHGVSTAKIEFLTSGVLLDGKNYKDFPDTLFLGVGGGPFDEHAVIGKKERVEGETCATLVAKDLGIESNPGLKRILYFAKQEDLLTSKVKDSLSVMIKFLHSKYRDNFEEISKWAIDAYYSAYMHDKNQGVSDSKDLDPITEGSSFKYLEEQNYVELSWWKKFIDDAIHYQNEQYKNALVEFDKHAAIHQVKTNSGAKLKLGVIDSTNEEMNKAGRSRGADALIIFQANGNVGIFTSHKKHIDLTFTFVLLRMAEQHYNGEVKIKDEKILSQEGMIEGIPWYLIHARNAGYNGSLTTKDIKPTKIPREKILAIVKAGLENL